MRQKSKTKTLDEILTYGYMPERFTTGYLELVRLGLKTEPSAQTFDNESKSVKKKYRTPDGGLKDEEALRFKAWVDRQLRAIGRDVQAYLNAREGKSRIITVASAKGGADEGARLLGHEIAKEMEKKAELKCKSPECKQYISWQWTHCAWCGRKIVGDSRRRG